MHAHRRNDMYENPILAIVLALKDVNYQMTMNYLEHEMTAKTQKYFTFEDVCMEKIPDLIDEVKQYKRAHHSQKPS